MRMLAVSVLAAASALATIGPATAEPGFDRFGGGPHVERGPQFGGGFHGPAGFVGRDGYGGGPYGPGSSGDREYRRRDWQHGLGWNGPGIGALGFGLPVYAAPPPVYFAPPPIVLGLRTMAPPRVRPVAAAAVPVFDPGPLLGAAVAPPVIVLPPPQIVAEAGPPPVIPTPIDSALPIVPPAVADAVIPRPWRVAGFITAAYLPKPVVIRRVVRREAIVEYEATPPFVVFAPPPPRYLGPPPWRPYWHERGWRGGWRY